MYNNLLQESRHHPADKLEDCITFALSHARLYSAESDDERDDKSDTADTFNISCGDGRSRSSLSDIVVSV